jgi:hypothetical protein
MWNPPCVRMLIALKIAEISHQKICDNDPPYSEDGDSSTDDEGSLSQNVGVTHTKNTEEETKEDEEPEDSQDSQNTQDSSEGPVPQKKRPFLSKTEQKPIYVALQKVLEKHLKDGYVQQLMHEFNSQKNEAMNSAIAKVAPKDLTFSTTKSLSFRIAVAVGLDSIGWDGYVAQVIAAINPLVATDDVLAQFLELRQKRKCYWKTRQERADVRVKRMQDVNDKVKKQKVDDDRAIREHVTYGSGIALLGEEEEDNTGTQDEENTGAINGVRQSVPSGNGKDGKQKSFCNTCKKPGHSRSSSKKCLFYKPRAVPKTQDIT